MAAITSAVSTVVATGAAAYSSYQSWDAAQDAKKDAQDMQKARNTQAADILEQIENEDILYQDDLDMIRKQNALAEDKLNLQTASAFEQTGDTLATVVAGSYNTKFQGGAGKRAASKARAAMKEESTDLLKSFEMGQSEIALQNEEAERQAEIRKDDIIGSLEANFEEITGEDIEDADKWQNIENKKEALRGATTPAEIIAAMSNS